MLAGVHTGLLGSSVELSKAASEGSVRLRGESGRGISVHPAAFDVVLLVDDGVWWDDVLHHHKHEFIAIPIYMMIYCVIPYAMIPI